MKRLWQRQLAYHLQLLKEIIYPRRCCACGVIIEEGCFCGVCRRSFLLLKKKSCRTGGAPDGSLRAEDVLDRAVFLYRYSGQLKELLHRIKFAGEAELLPLLREEAEAALPEGWRSWLAGFDAVCCIPSAEERRRKRGFDLPAEIFACFGRSPAQDNGLLVRSRHTQPLYDMNPAERRSELSGCFELGAGRGVRGCSVLLCDDIYTTGSTLAEAAALLRSCGAARVEALAFAAARDNW